jgi:hypothetical protein
LTKRKNEELILTYQLFCIRMTPLVRFGLKKNCVSCRQDFVICKSCYRGHRYCSADCRALGYRQHKANSRKKYDSSAEAKADHRDRQREFRKRKKTQRQVTKSRSSVTDQTSILKKSNIDLHSASFSYAGGFRCCCICGGKVILVKHLEESWIKSQLTLSTTSAPYSS